MSRPRYLFLIVVVALTVVFAGCSKVTPENYDKIQTGMTVDQVEQILGKGEVETGGGLAIGEVAASGKVMKWGTEEKSITVTFANDKVVMKAKKGF